LCEVIFTMPVYEYECKSCHHRFEKRQGFHDEAKAACPKCGGKAKRLIRASPVIFKGSGFYVTDHRPSNEKHAESGKNESKEKPSAGKSESKGEPPAVKSKRESTTAKSE
jgi:putative FmdB family regulatory protein